MTERRPTFNITRIDDEHSREMQRRNEARRNLLVPIYFQYTSDVPAEEAHAGLLGVMDAMRAAGQQRELVNFGSSSFGQGDFSNPDWYANEAYRKQSLRRDAGFGQQIDVEAVMDLLRNEPYQEQPHWEVFITGADLNLRVGREYINFVFGATLPEFATVQSINRLSESIPSGNLRNAMIRRLLRHEVGHMFGLPSQNRRNTEEKLGQHCVNPCTMRQGVSIPEWRDLTIEEHNNGIHFCTDCQHDLAQSRSKYRSLPPKPHA